MPAAATQSRNAAALPPVERLSLQGDATQPEGWTTSDGAACAIEPGSVDLVVTSPPYWRKRDYGMKDQLGQEATAEKFADRLVRAMHNWRKLLSPSGSIFLNIGDTYRRKSLEGVPALVEVAARGAGFKVRNRIVWAKQGGRPDPVKDRLANRHESVIHFVGSGPYYYDLFGYSEVHSPDQRGANPGDVWELAQTRDMSRHLAPFPAELAERAILLGCPREVCVGCGLPRRRKVRRSLRELDADRPQARRALELAEEYGLTDEHIRAIQATGISDAGKAKSIQSGTGRNSDSVKELAAQAKEKLGGYFREFTFTKQEHIGWSDCGCGAGFRRGRVLDPFAGTGTTLRAAEELGRDSVGVDLDAEMVREASS